MAAKYLNQYVLIFLCVCITLFSGGCSFSRAPDALSLKFQADSTLNPDIKGRPSPLVVLIYQLKSAAAFQDADFFALYNQPSKVLGADLIKKDEIEIKPKQKLTLDYSLSSDTRYLGIVGAYRDLQNSNWRNLLEVYPGKTKKITLKLEGTTTNIQIK